MSYEVKLTIQNQIREKLLSNKLIILLEIALVLAPTYISLILGYRPESDFISLGDDLILLGGPLIWLAMTLSLFLLWVVTRLRGASWKDYGGSRPASWLRTMLSGVGLSIIMIVAIVILQELLSLAIPDAAPPDMSRFDALHGNLPNLLVNVVVLWITAGFIEELIWRGYLINRLTHIFGQSRMAWVIVLFCSAALFGVAHFYQGPSGILLTGTTGLLIGAAFLLVRRNLWPLVIAHGLINTISFVDMFFNGI